MSRSFAQKDAQGNGSCCPVLPDLWIGNLEAAQAAGKLNPKRFTHVLNVSDKSILQDGTLGNGVVSFQIPLDDFGRDDLFAKSCPYVPRTNKQDLYWRCKAFVFRAMQDGGRVLVHCAVGVNRSATIVLALLMEMEGWSLRRAAKYVGQRRKIRPCAKYWAQLQAFEKKRGLQEHFWQRLVPTKKAPHLKPPGLDMSQLWAPPVLDPFDTRPVAAAA